MIFYGAATCSVAITMALSVATAYDYDDATTCRVLDDPNSRMQPDELPGWVPLLVRLVNTFSDSHDTFVVPLYSITVTLYLLIVYFRNGLKNILPLPEFLLKSCTHDATTVLSKHQWKASSPPPSTVRLEPSLLPPETAEVGVTATNKQELDWTGSYKLVANDNFDAFLAAQGVPWALRRAALQVWPVHHITHTTTVNDNNHTQRDRLMIRIEVAASGFGTQTVYEINGDPVETNVRGRIFRDAVRYYYHPDHPTVIQGVVTEKTAVTEGYLVTVTRRWSDDQQHIYMTSTASFPNEPTKATVVSTQVFDRIA